MALLANLRLLDKGELRLSGELPPELLDLEGVDEVVHARQPLRYDLKVQKLESGILVQGWLDLMLDCDCVRCLKPVPYRLRLDDWTCLVSLEGEEKADVRGDCVDLTPYLREDILLEFPQHPLCEPECGGLPDPAGKSKKTTGAAGQSQAGTSAWAALNKLKI